MNTIRQMLMKILHGGLVHAGNEDAPALVDAINDFSFSSDWKMVCPFGDFPIVLQIGGKPTKVIQRVDVAAANCMAEAFSSLRGKVQGALVGYPIYKGHPDLAGWKPADGSAPDMAHYGAIENIVVGANSLTLEANYKKAGRALIDAGNTKYHSEHWGLLPLNENTPEGTPVYRPVVLFSVGLTDRPNIPVPAVNEEDAATMADAADEANAPRKAAKSSAAAYTASADALKSGKGADHYAAAVAHHKAAKSHTDAGNKDTAAQHKAEALSHMAQSKKLAAAGNEADPADLDWSGIPDAAPPSIVEKLSAIFGLPAVTTGESLVAFAAGLWASVVAALQASEQLEDAAGMQEAGNTAAAPVKTDSAGLGARVAAFVDKLRTNTATLRERLTKAEKDFQAATTAAANDKAQVTAAANELAGLKQQITAAMLAVANEQAARAELVVDAGIRAGKLILAHRPAWLRSFSKDFTGTLAAINEAPPLMRIAPRTEFIGQRTQAAANAGSGAKFLQAVNDCMAKDFAGDPLAWDKAWSKMKTAHPELHALMGQPAGTSGQG